MPVKTITAEIDGTVRKITADIPDDARPEEIESAVRAHLSANPRGDKFDQMKSELESRAPMSMLDKAKELGKLAISPITGIPGAIRDALSPAEARDRNLNPETASGIPGQSTNPLADAYGNTVAALATSKGAESIHEPALARLRSAGPEEAPPAETPEAPGSTMQIPSGVLHKIGRFAMARLFPGGAQFYDIARAAAEGAAPKPLAEALTPKAPTVPQIYEDIAQSLARKPYAELDAKGQAAVKDAASRIQGSSNGIPAGPKAPRSMADYGVSETRIETGTPGNAPTNGVPGSSIPVEVPSPATADASTQPRETPPKSSTVKQFSPKMKVSEIADLLASKAQDWGFSPDEVRSMNAKGWNKLAFDAGVPGGLSEPMMRRVIQGLKQKLAGPEVAPEVLLDRLKASLADRPKLTGKALDIAKALKEELERK